MEKAKELGVYVNDGGDCGCCGSRWYSAEDPETASEKEVLAEAARLENDKPYKGWAARDNIPVTMVLSI